MSAAIGIDIGGTNARVGLVSESGEVLRQKRLKVAAFPEATMFLNALTQTISEVAAAETILGIGVGAPAANSKRGVIEKASNLPWQELPIVAALSAAFRVPVRLTNDANLFAIGEGIFGNAKEMTDFVVVTLGTGVGAGIFSNGQLVEGKDGLAGEVGHTIYERNGRPCLCGRQGCLERYASVSGLMLTVSQLLAENKLSTSLKNESLTAEQVALAASQGDALAQRAFDLTGQALGESLADVVACLNPEAMFLAGGLTNAGVLILEPTRRSFQRSLLAIYPRTIPLLPSALPEAHAGILGAAALAFKSLFSTELTTSQI